MLGKDNWIDISWGGQPVRTGNKNIQVDILKKSSNIMPFQAACDLVAHDIASQYDNLFVTFSGGCDSENIVNTLLRNKIPFTVLMITYGHSRFKDQQYEQWFARHWCRKNNIIPLEIDVSSYIETPKEHKQFVDYKPRLPFGLTTSSVLLDIAEQHKANLITGMQLEYYPDYEQMTYLEPQLGSYQGFVFEESDFYLETLAPNRHPWGFYYWCPEIMSSFVNDWNTDLNMQENKSCIYNVSPRPKMGYPADLYSNKVVSLRRHVAKRWGTRDCALLGTKTELLNSLVSYDN